MKLYQIIALCILCTLLSGCSFLKVASAPFKSTKTTAPTKIDKGKKTFSCKGDLVLDKSGNVVSCKGGFTSNEEYFNQSERKLTGAERVKQFIDKFWGWTLWAIIASIVATCLGLGVWVSNFWNSVFGIGGKALKALSTGLTKAKQYVRSNGTGYSPEEREIYYKGVDDFLDVLDDEIKDSNVVKLLYKIRGEVKASNKS